MKKSRFTQEQITYTLRLAESGAPVADVCRKMGISDAASLHADSSGSSSDFPSEHVQSPSCDIEPTLASGAS
jgi:hypothetical protein